MVRYDKVFPRLLFLPALSFFLTRSHLFGDFHLFPEATMFRDRCYTRIYRCEKSYRTRNIV